MTEIRKNDYELSKRDIIKAMLTIRRSGNMYEYLEYHVDSML